MKNLIPILFIALFFQSCTETERPIRSNANGVWQQLGYGKIFEIENDSVKIYDICKVGCSVFEHDLLRSNGVVESYTEDSLFLRKNMKTYKFIRLDALPILCEKGDVDKYSPQHNFEVLWNTFNENYSFFEKRKVDWDEVYATYRPKITHKTSELELFQIANEMLSSLNDGHVSLDTPESLSDTLEVLNDKEKKKATVKAKVNSFELGDRIANRYCKDIKKHNTGIVKWGMMKDDVAYIQINAMWFLAYYGIPQDLPFGEFHPLYGAKMEKRIAQREDEIKGADLLMDTIVADIQHAKALVLDLRFNQGGKDEVAFEFIGHLVNERLKVSSKKARLGNGFTNHQSMFLEPKKPYFDKNVYVLISSMTASAAEIAVLSSLPYSNFTKIGSNTEGIFSDGLDKVLPNGWEYRLSNEIYLDTEGMNYEGIGIPPDIELNYPRGNGAMINLILSQVESSGDEAIERVFKLELEENKK